MKELSQTLTERLLLMMSKYDINLSDAQRDIVRILNDYDVQPKETALAVYTDGKNEMYIKRFVLAKAVAGCSERTVKQYKESVERFLQTVNKDADCVTSNDIQAYIADALMRGTSKSYADTIRRYLSSFYAFLSREELIQKNPMLKVEKIKYHTEKESAFTELEVEKIRASCKNARETALVELLLSTGCRASEAASIKIDDINDDKVTVFGKGGKYRNVYLNAKCVIAIEAYIKERKDNNPYLFPSGIKFGGDQKLLRRLRKEKGNWYKYRDLVDPSEHINHESINSSLKRIGKRAGVDGVHTHRFRRTCATMALRRGMTIELVSKMLGHEELATTQIYLGIREDDLEIAHKKFVY